MYSLRWRSVHGGSCISTLLSIPLPNGPSSSSGISGLRSSVSLPDSRPGLDLFGEHRWGTERLRRTCVEDAGPSAPSQRILRATDRDHSQRVSRLDHSVLRESLEKILREFIVHYNRGRPHSSLGPGIPEPSQAEVPAGPHRHALPKGYRVISTPILGDLHHEYRLEKEAA